jgi:3-hydroxybutyryl-CoA dehydrogenase
MDVAVLGADRVAEAVAARCLHAGHRVRLQATDANAVMDAVDAVERSVDADSATAVDGTTDLEAAVGDADVVLDTTGGDVETARARLADVEDLASDDVLVATGAPTLSVTAVAAGLRRPGRAVGLHFVDPDGPLVEVVLAEQSTGAARDDAVAFVEGLESTPIVVSDAPGFATTRLDLALVAEAIRMVEDGVASVRDVDRSMTVGRDHPTAPLVLADELGLAAVLETLEDLTDRLGDRFSPPALLREKVADGHVGKAVGRGFYVWEGGEPSGPAEPDPVVGTRDRPQGPTEP